MGNPSMCITYITTYVFTETSASCSGSATLSIHKVDEILFTATTTVLNKQNCW